MVEVPIWPEEIFKWDFWSEKFISPVYVELSEVKFSIEFPLRYIVPLPANFAEIVALAEIVGE